VGLVIKPDSNHLREASLEMLLEHYMMVQDGFKA